MSKVVNFKKHDTPYCHLREKRKGWQYAGFKYIRKCMDASEFTQAFLRIDQTSNDEFVEGQVNYIQPTGNCQSVYLELVDAEGQQVLIKLFVWGETQAFASQILNEFSESRMNIIRVSLVEHKEQIDLSKIHTIGLMYIPDGTGPLVLDHIHWVGN